MILYSIGDPDLKISVRGKKIVFVGKGFQARRFLIEILSIRRAFVQVNVNKSTDLLITDNLNSTSKVLRKAKELNIKILTYEEVFR